MKATHWISACLATLIASAVALGQTAPLTALGLSSLGGAGAEAAQSAQATSTEEQEEQNELVQEIIEDCLRCWRQMVQEGKWGEARSIAEKAARLNPQHLAAKQACFLSQVLQGTASGSAVHQVVRPVNRGRDAACCNEANACSEVRPTETAKAACQCTTCSCADKCGCVAPHGVQVVTGHIFAIPTVQRHHPNITIDLSSLQMPAQVQRLHGGYMLPPPPLPPLPPLPHFTNAFPPPVIMTQAHREPTPALQIVAGDHRVLVATPNLEAQCQRLTFAGSQDRVQLEGNVQLISRKDGQVSKIEAQRVLVDLARGTFTVETNTTRRTPPAGLPTVEENRTRVYPGDAFEEQSAIRPTTIWRFGPEILPPPAVE